MSTELIPNPPGGHNRDVSLTQFYGGSKRGLSFQISVATGSDREWDAYKSISLTDKQMAQVVCAYVMARATGKV